MVSPAVRPAVPTTTPRSLPPSPWVPCLGEQPLAAHPRPWPPALALDCPAVGWNRAECTKPWFRPPLLVPPHSRQHVAPKMTVTIPGTATLNRDHHCVTFRVPSNPECCAFCPKKTLNPIFCGPPALQPSLLNFLTPKKMLRIFML